MAKKSMKVRDEKRIKMVARFQTLRQKLKTAIVSVSSSDEERETSQRRLQAMPRNASPVRVQRRCQQCGRPHAVYRKFGLCRICLRQNLMNGHVPGGRKASW